LRDRGGGQKNRRKESQEEVVIQSEAKAWVCIGATIFSKITKTQKRGNKEKKKKRG